MSFKVKKVSGLLDVCNLFTFGVQLLVIGPKQQSVLGLYIVYDSEGT